MKLPLTCVQTAAEGSEGGSREREREKESGVSRPGHVHLLQLLLNVPQCGISSRGKALVLPSASDSGRCAEAAGRQAGKQVGGTGSRLFPLPPLLLIIGIIIIVIIYVVSSCSWHNDKRTFIKFLISDFIVD